jgi:O-succinylbenzoic acid--CoA ligase
MEIALQHLKQIKNGELVLVQLGNSSLLIEIIKTCIEKQAILALLSPKIPQLDLHIKELCPRLVITNNDSIMLIQKFKPPLPLGSFLLLTSGSSGKSKWVSLSLENLLTSAKIASKKCEFYKGDLWYLSLPLFHVGGLGIFFRGSINRGNYTLDPRDENITHVSYVPTQLYRNPPTYLKLKTLILSGAPLNHISKDYPIFASYGMTETASMILGTKEFIQKGREIFLGFPFEGTDFKVSEESELFIKGATLFNGYYENKALVATDEWFGTKDIVKINPEYGIAIVGRKDNQFISGGENIQPEEIERHILTISGIQEAIVVPIEDLEYGKRPFAFIKPWISENILKEHLLSVLPKFKIPKYFRPLTYQNLKPSRKELEKIANTFQI